MRMHDEQQGRRGIVFVPDFAGVSDLDGVRERDFEREVVVVVGDEDTRGAVVVVVVALPSVDREDERCR